MRAIVIALALCACTPQYQRTYLSPDEQALAECRSGLVAYTPTLYAAAMQGLQLKNCMLAKGYREQ